MTVVVQSPPQLQLADGLVKHMYQLCQMSPKPCSEAIVQCIVATHDQFVEACEQRGGKGVPVTLDMVSVCGKVVKQKTHR